MKDLVSMFESNEDDFFAGAENNHSIDVEPELDVIKAKGSISVDCFYYQSNERMARLSGYLK